jgi:hypothetical protein
VSGAARIAVVLALLGACAGCRTLAPPPPVPLPPGDPRPQALLEALEARARSRDSVRAEGRLSVDAPDLRFGSSRLRVAAERPARLRVEVVAPLFGQLLWVLVTRGDHYQYFDPDAPALYEGPVTPYLLWEVARVDLAPREAVELLLGAARPEPGLHVLAAEERPDGWLEVSLADGSERLRQRLAFDAAGLLRRLASFAPSGALLRDIRLDDYRDVGGVPFAHETDLHFPPFETRATFSFVDVEVDADLPDELFVLRLPERSAEAEEAP